MADQGGYAVVQALLLPLVYNLEFHVVICQECQHGLGSLRNIKRHLSQHFQGTELKTFTKQCLSRLEALGVEDLGEVAALQCPKPYTTSFQDLKEIKGYSCRGCPYLTSNYKALRVHLNTRHSVKSQDKRADSLTRHYRFPITLQTFSGNRKNASYFITSQNPRPADGIRDTDTKQVLSDYKTFYQQLVRDPGDNREELESKELSGFLLNSRWHEYFLENDKETALLLLQKPNPKELASDQDQILNTAYNTTRGLIPKLEGLIRLVSRRNLQMLHSETLNPPHKEMRAFKAVTKQSQGKYHALFPSLVVYLLNVYYVDLKSKGKAAKAPQPDLEPVRPLLSDLIRLVSDLQTINDRESSDYENALELVEDQIIALVITLLQQELQQQSLYTNSLFQNPVITFSILSSIDPQTGNFKEEALVQNSTSILIYNFRLFFLGHIRFLSKQETDPGLEQAGFDFNHTFQTLYRQFLTNTSNNCFEELTQLRAYTHKISSTKFKPGRIIDHNVNEVEIDSKRIRIDSLRTFFYSIISQLDDLLHATLLFTAREDLCLSTQEIKDDIFNQKIGFYFADFVNSEQDLGRYKEFLIRKLFDRDSLISKTLVRKADGKRLVFDSTAIRELDANRTRFLELLLVAIYLTSGSPIRGEEILLLRYFNTLTTKNRNIVIDPKTNLIRLVTTYYKSYNITRAEKTNIRFLCPRLSRILKTYLLIFIPLYHFLNIYHANRKQISADLFENKGVRYTSARLTTVLGRESLKSLGERITINPYRHLIKYIIKTRINSSYESDSEEEDLIEDIQANHSTKTSDLGYSRDSTNQLYNTTISIETRSLSFNLRFFSYFGIGQEARGSKHTRQASSVDQGNKKQRAIDFQSFAERIANQELLQPIRPEAASLLDSLKSLLRSKTAAFRSEEQEAAIRSVISREPQITYISGTGSGKSLLFFLPYYLYPKWHFFVVTPRVSLKDDLQQRAAASGLESEIFCTDNAIQKQMVFLSVKDLHSKRFQNHISYLIAQKQEVSFFFDEAHLLVLEEDFRYVLKYIPDIVRYQQQLVFISATLPDCLLNVLESKFSLTRNQVIRGSTTRKNIAYHIRLLHKQEVRIDVVRSLYHELQAKLAPGEKIVIYCPYKSDCEFLGKELGILCYYSDKPGKEAILKRFQSDTQTTTIAGTTALGVGIDVAHVRFSIHPYKVNSLIALDQEIGRIGRDNQPSASYIIVDINSYRYRPAVSKEVSVENAKIIDLNRAVDFVKETRCARIVLESYFNQRTITRCDINVCQACYICLRKHQTTAQTVERHRGAAIRTQEAFVALEDQLVRLQSACYPCLLQAGKDGSQAYGHHSLNDCQSIWKHGFIDQVRQLERVLKRERLFTAGSCCFQCFLPPRFCSNRAIHEAPCPFQYIVLETIVFMHQVRQRRPDLIGPLVQGDTTRNRVANDSQTFSEPGVPASLAREIATHVVYHNSDAIKAILIILELDIKAVEAGLTSRR